MLPLAYTGLKEWGNTRSVRVWRGDKSGVSAPGIKTRTPQSYNHQPQSQYVTTSTQQVWYFTAYWSDHLSDRFIDHLLEYLVSKTSRQAPRIQQCGKDPVASRASSNAKNIRLSAENSATQHISQQNHSVELDSSSNAAKICSMPSIQPGRRYPSKTTCRTPIIH